MLQKADKTKVAFFIPTLRGGGAERIILNIARGFYECNFSVDLVLAKAEGPYLKDVPRGVEVINLNVGRVLYALLGLVRYLRREKPKALISALTHANILAIWAKMLSHSETKLVVSEHTTLSIATKGASSIKLRIMPFLVRLFYPKADAIVAVSKGIAEDLINLIGVPQEKVHVIYNPVVTPDIFVKAEEPLSHPWFQSGEPPVILSAGRLAKEKDFLTLIRAFALVRKKIPARLMILGEGEERTKLETLVEELRLKEDIALPGFVDNPYKYMKRAAVFVLSSRWEGLPTVLIESLALGTPVVATDCPSGPKEILEDGKFGILVEPGKPSELAKAILSILQAPRKVTDFDIRKYTLNFAVNRYLAVLREEHNEANG